MPGLDGSAGCRTELVMASSNAVVPTITVGYLFVNEPHNRYNERGLGLVISCPLNVLLGEKQTWKTH